MSSSDTADDWGQDADADRRAAYSPKSHPPESNRRPTDYESVALPTELGWPMDRGGYWPPHRRSSKTVLPLALSQPRSAWSTASAV